MSKLRVSRDATADLDEIWLHIANRGGVEAAQRYINHLTAKKIGIRCQRRSKIPQKRRLKIPQ